DVATPHIEAVLEELGRRGPSGDATLQGRLWGALRDPDIEAEARFDTLTYAGAYLWKATAGIWGRAFGAQPRLDIELRADSLQAQGHRLRAVAADLVWAAPAL